MFELRIAYRGVRISPLSFEIPSPLVMEKATIAADIENIMRQSGSRTNSQRRKCVNLEIIGEVNKEIEKTIYSKSI